MLLIYMLLVVPIRLFLVWVVPTLRHTDFASGLWDLPIYRLSDPPAYAILIALLCAAYFAVTYLWKRWGRIVNALA